MEEDYFMRKLLHTLTPTWGDELFPTDPQETLMEGSFPFTELLIGNSGNEGTFWITTERSHQFGYTGKRTTKYDRKEAKIELTTITDMWMGSKNTTVITDNFSFVRKLLRKEYDALKPKSRRSSESKSIGRDEIIEAYLPVTNEEEDFDWRLKVADAMGDLLFVCPTLDYATVAAQTGTKVYYYDFQYRPSNSIWADWIGPTHFDEIDFIFGGPFKSPSQYPQKERRLSKMMIKHWTNFVKNGKPNSDWPLYSNRSETIVYTSDRPPITSCEPRGYNCRAWRDYISSINLNANSDTFEGYYGTYGYRSPK